MALTRLARKHLAKLAYLVLAVALGAAVWFGVQAREQADRRLAAESERVDRRLAAQSLANCMEIEERKNAERRHARRDFLETRRAEQEAFANLDRTLKILRLQRTREIVELAEQNRDRAIARAKARRDATVADAHQEDCPRARRARLS